MSLIIYLLLLFILYIPEKTQRHLQNTSDFLFDAYGFLEPHRKLLMKSAKHLQIRKCVPKCKQMSISCRISGAKNVSTKRTAAKWLPRQLTTDPGSDLNSPAGPAWPPTPVETGSCGPAAWWPTEVCNTSHKQYWMSRALHTATEGKCKCGQICCK